MKKVSTLILILIITTVVPFAFAREKSASQKVIGFAAADVVETISAESVAAQFPAALNANDAALLESTLLSDDVRFGSYYGAWWDGWETNFTVAEMLAQIWRFDALGQLSAETLPNEPTWFLQDLNPYTDLLPDETVEVVLLVRNFSENSDAEMLVWISADAQVSAMVLSATGFQRVSR